MRSVNGKWYYQSFFSPSPVIEQAKTPPEVKISSLTTLPWTPQTKMELVTDSNGAISGAAMLGKFEFRITGSIKPAKDPIPEGIELIVFVDAASATYNLRGFFVANSDVIMGTVVSLGNDLGKQPLGASGPFILFPVPS